jgi:hypothetical protein
MALYLKACPRCNGDLVPEAFDDNELFCLQCSFRTPLSKLRSAGATELRSSRPRPQGVRVLPSLGANS